MYYYEIIIKFSKAKFLKANFGEIAFAYSQNYNCLFTKSANDIIIDLTILRFTNK